MRSRGSAWTAAACRRCVCDQDPGWNRTLHERNWRDAFHRVPWPGWNRALHRIVTTGPEGVTRPSKGMLSPRVDAGALGAGAAGGPLQAGKRWPSGVAHLQEHQQRRNDRSAQPRKNGPGRGAVDTSLEAGCVCSPTDRPVLGSGQGGSSVGFGDPLVYRALAPAVPAQPPRQGVQKLKCAAVRIPRACGPPARACLL